MFATRAGYRPEAGRSAGGFTLLEIIVVLSILTVILGAVSPVFMQSLQINRRDQAIRDLVAYLKFAQERAVADGVEYRLYLDHKAGTYWVMRFDRRDGEEKSFEPAQEPYAGKRRFPEQVEVQKPKARDDRDRKASFIAFYPNGACDYATIRLRYGDHGRYEISTEGSLGTFDIEEKED